MKVVYVDNCCNVCRVLQRCFPGALVKLDAFHWLKRWADILFDAKSGHAGVFRALMSKALFTCGADEFEDAKSRLVSRGKANPTTKDIMKEANSVIPPPALLRANVEAVIEYCLAKDAQADRMTVLRREGDDSPKPARFFKSNKELVKDTIRKQMRHVDKGCLSDPPRDLVNIFRYNASTKRCYVARGTNTNERDNLDLATKILTATHIGIVRADRLMCNFFERKNQDKCVVRLGDDDNGIYETERHLIINSYAASLGYDKSTLPFPRVAAPTVCRTAPKEYMGFSYNLPEKFHKVTNPANAVVGNNVLAVDDLDNEDTDADSDEGDDGLTEAQKDDFMHILGDEMDVEIIADDGEYEELPDPYAEIELRRLEVAEEGRLADSLPINRDFIQRELARLVPNEDGGRESTLDAFKRLTSDNAWIPFRMPDSSMPETETDKAEASYFNEQQSAYSIKVKSGPKSYKNFAIKWNQEVSRRYKLWSKEDAEKDQIHLRLKSEIQLEEYYKKYEELNSLQRTANDEDSSEAPDNDRALLDTQLRTTRTFLPPRQEPHIVAPPTFIPQANSIMPFAHPATLNASIAMGAVLTTNNHLFLQPTRQTMNIPYQMMMPNLPRDPPTRPVRKVFRSKMFCTTCGWRKKEHTVEEGNVRPQGKNMKPEDCRREFCGNCMDLKKESWRRSLWQRLY